MMFFPTIRGNCFGNNAGEVGKISQGITKYWQPTGPNVQWDIAYNAIYFFLIIGFTYFYTAVVFKPDETADNLKKQAIFIPGIRPGRSTAEYLDKEMTRLTPVGPLFLAPLTLFIPLFSRPLAFGHAASRNNWRLYLAGA